MKIINRKLKNRIWLYLPVLISGLVILTSCQSNNNAASGSDNRKIIRVSYDDPVDFNSEIHLSAWIFQNYINSHSRNLQVKLYGSGSLGHEREVYEALQLGSGATCVISGTAILNNFAPRTGVLDLSFLWQNYDHVHRVLDGEVGQVLARDLENQGIRVLAWLDSWGYRNLVTSTKEVRSAKDIAGLKIRTIQSPFNIAAINNMGANATPMAFGEIYSSMQTGILDGFEHNATIVQTQKLYEVGKYMALTRHLFGPLVICFSAKMWQDLSPEDQKITQEAAYLARDIERALAPIREAQSLEFLKDKGMVITEIDRSGLAVSAKKLQDELALESGAVDLLEKIRQADVKE